MHFLLSLLIGSFFVCSALTADDTLEQLKARQVSRAIHILLENVSPEGALPGTIIASPSRNQPNYFRHWVRDGGHVVSVIIGLWEKAEGERKQFLEKLLWDFVLLSGRQQHFIEEPVFNPDGTPISEEWGRPQPDGPALRAIPLIHFAQLLLRSGRGFEVVHSPARPGDLKSVISKDLEAILAYGDKGYDIWEEQKGNHFYTRMVQRKALLMGVRFLRALAERDLASEADIALAGRCQRAIHPLELEIQTHWDAEKNYLRSSLNIEAGILHKTSQLDAQVILGVLHGDTHDGFFGPAQYRVIATVDHLEDTFLKLYPINSTGPKGIAIGRYPEDDWNGYERGKEGNPWIITTEAFGEFHDKLANELVRAKKITIVPEVVKFYSKLLGGHTAISPGMIYAGEPQFDLIVRALRVKADGYYERVLYHLGEGDFHEQFNRHNGFLQGPHRLTWSCVALIVGEWTRGSRQ